MLGGVSWKRFFKDLKGEISEDNVSTGAAALAYYLMLALFPALIMILTLLPYLPVPDLDRAILDFLGQALPRDAYDLVAGTVQGIVSERRGGLLTFGLLATLWSASSGMYAIMQQLNITYDVKEGRSFIKTRATALLLTALFFLLVVGAFALIVFGGIAQAWLAERFGWSTALTTFFATARWVIIGVALLLAFAVTYFIGPDVEQKFKFISPGAVLGVVLLAAGAVAFQVYVSNFANYSKVYGSLGAVIMLLFWLYLTGWVILFGSEVNALVEHYSAEGKPKGQKREVPRRGGPLHPVPRPT